jgi:hypothetical protein
MPLKTIIDLSGYHYSQQLNLPSWDQSYFQAHAQTGDVLVFSGTSLASKFIELTGPYSHTAIVVRFGDHPDELMVCEAQQQVGFRCFQSWRMFDDYWGDNQPIGANTSLYRVADLTALHKHRLISSVRQLLGSLYSNKRIAQIVLHWIAHKITGKDQPFLPVEFNHLECAEAVEWLYAKIGKSLPDDKTIGAFTPSSIVAADSPLKQISDIVYTKKVTDVSRRVIDPNQYSKQINWLTTVAQRLASGGRVHALEKNTLSRLARELLPGESTVLSSVNLFAPSDRHLRQASNVSAKNVSGGNDFGRLLVATGVMSLLLLSVGLLFILKKLIHQPRKVSRQSNSALAAEKRSLVLAV